MVAIQQLSDEHRVILHLLRGLEVLVWRSSAEATIDREAAHEVLRFLERFAQARHVTKESAWLYVLLEERGIPRSGGPLATMFQEHDRARRLLQEMRRVLAGTRDEGQASGDGEPEGSAAAFADHAGHYLALMRDHIDKEDHCLFQMARQVLTPADEKWLEAAYARIDAADPDHPRWSDVVAAADDLARRLGVPRLGSRPRSRRPHLRGRWASAEGELATGGAD